MEYASKCISYKYTQKVILYINIRSKLYKHVHCMIAGKDIRLKYIYIKCMYLTKAHLYNIGQRPLYVNLTCKPYYI